MANCQLAISRQAAKLPALYFPFPFQCFPFGCALRADDMKTNAMSDLKVKFHLPSLSVSLSLSLARQSFGSAAVSLFCGIVSFTLCLFRLAGNRGRGSGTVRLLCAKKRCTTCASLYLRQLMPCLVWHTLPRQLSYATSLSHLQLHVLFINK